MVNALTIDVEDYFQVSAFDRYVKREEWGSYPLRVRDNTLRVLDMLDEFNIRATFFVLGWLAERMPGLVREIHRKGHEIACHGYGHQIVYRLGQDKFRSDVSRARKILEDCCGERVCGYRAPSYSITESSIWALGILVEEGFTFDSSIFPVYHDTYGIPDAPRFHCRIDTPSGPITEFPLTTHPVNVAGKEYRLPIAGGGYLRLFPAWLLEKFISVINKEEGQPAVFYFHPWEIDPDQPRVKAGFKSSLRHYLNLEKTEFKLRYLFSSLSFGRIADVMEKCRGCNSDRMIQGTRAMGRGAAVPRRYSDRVAPPLPEPEPSGGQAPQTCPTAIFKQAAGTLTRHDISPLH